MWHASLLRWRLAGRNLPFIHGEQVEGSPQGEAGGRERCLRTHLAASSELVEATWADVHRALVAAGWDLSVVHLDGDGGSVDVSTSIGMAEATAKQTS